MITRYFVKERNVAKKQYTSNGKAKRIPFTLILKSLLTEKYFIITIILYLLWYLRKTDNGMRVYYATYIFDNADVMAILSVGTLLPIILVMLFAPKFAEIVGIKISIIIGLVISIISIFFMSLFLYNLSYLIV